MLLNIAIRALETIFAVGVIGSALVVVLTSIEDFKTLLRKDKER